LPFYLSTWEEFHTGTLFLGVVNGPTEGLIAGVVVKALSGVYGEREFVEIMGKSILAKEEKKSSGQGRDRISSECV
jgi:hypothetical protein